MSAPPENAVILLSGGLDSAVAGAMARAQVGASRCHAITFDYGQRHRQELSAAVRVANSLGIEGPRHVLLAIDLRAIGGSALTDEIAVPKDSVGNAGVPATYVPARNLIFLSCAAALSETVGATSLYIGANAVDYSGYPDCREAFLRAFEAAANLGTKAGDEGRPLRVEAPLVHMSKAQIIRRGVELGVDFSLTHSCYDPNKQGRACEHCDSCLLRARGFAEAGVSDPTVYVGERAGV